MSLKVCADPGCAALIPKGQSRCQTHERSKDKAIKQRDSDRRKVYFTARWRGGRRAILREQPWCAVEGCHNLATQIDHITPLRDGIDPYERANLQGLCAKHHSEKTAREVWHRKGTG